MSSVTDLPIKKQLLYFVLALVAGLVFLFGLFAVTGGLKPSSYHEQISDIFFEDMNFINDEGEYTLKYQYLLSKKDGMIYNEVPLLCTRNELEKSLHIKLRHADNWSPDYDYYWFDDFTRFNSFTDSNDRFGQIVDADCEFWFADDKLVKIVLIMNEIPVDEERQIDQKTEMAKTVFYGVGVRAFGDRLLTKLSNLYGEPQKADAETLTWVSESGMSSFSFFMNDHKIELSFEFFSE